MAQFNPDVNPDKLDHYWYWSKPVSPTQFAAPEGNKIAQTYGADTSKGEALKGVGDIMASGLKAADAVVDSSAKFESEQASREERARRIGELSGASDSLLGGDDKPDQEKIEGALAPLNILKQARANGHLSDTDYWMRVDARLSDIRSRYPVAYRDDIDNTSTRILGENAANAVVRSQTADINALLSAQKAAQNKIMSRLDKAIDDGVPGADGWKALYQARKLTEPDLDKNLNNAYAPFYKQKLLDAQIKSLTAQGQIDAAGHLSMDSFNITAEQASKSHWDLYDHQTGMTTDTASTMKLNAQESQQRYQWVAAQEAGYRQQMQEEVTRPREELGGRSYLQVHGKTETDAAIERGAQRFAIEKGILSNPDFGAIHRDRKLLDAANSDFMVKALGVDSVAKYYQQSQFLKQNMSPEQVQKYFESQAANMPGVIKDLTNVQHTLRFGAQPGDPPRPISQDFKEIQGTKIGSPAAYDKVANVIADVVNNPASTPQAKSIAFDSVYDPSNSGFMGILSSPSQLTMYNKFTDKRFTEAVRQDGTPKQKQDMVNWAELSFRNMLTPDVKSLGEFQDMSGVTILWNKPEGDKAPSFGATVGQDRRDILSYGPRSGTITTGLSEEGNKKLKIRESLERLNAGIHGLYNVYDGDTAQIEKAMFQLFDSLGFKPEPKKVENLPDAIANAIYATRAKAEGREKTKSSLGQ